MSPYLRKRFFTDHFLSFFRFCFLVYLDNYRKSAGLDSFEPFNKHQVTLRNKHKNHLFLA